MHVVTSGDYTVEVREALAIGFGIKILSADITEVV
jgi:hypothetical protein